MAAKSKKKIQKKSATKKTLAVKARKAPVKSSTTKKVVKPLIVKASRTPARAPQRKVNGSDRTLTVVEPRTLPVDEIITLIPVDIKEVQVESPQVDVKPAPRVNKPYTRTAWSALPKTFPPHIRFFVAMAEKECRSASTWPFPYAKFLAALPVKMCGRAFAALLLWSDFDSEAVAQKLSIPVVELEQLLAQEGAHVLEYFTQTCPDMYRKLATQLGGVGVSIENLAERYLVSKVDRDFQLFLARLMLKLMAQ